MTFDFIKYVIDIFREEFAKERDGAIYYDSEKDRGAVGKLLAKFKKRHPKKESEDMCDMLREYFKDALRLQDNWYHSNMSLPLINSKVNEINQQIKELRFVKGQQRKDKKVKDGLENMRKFYGAEIEEIWNPKKKDKDYKNPHLTKVEFLRQVGYARMNEWKIYKNNME